MKAIDLKNPECKAHIDALNAKSLAHLRAKIAAKRHVRIDNPLAKLEYKHCSGVDCPHLVELSATFCGLCMPAAKRKVLTVQPYPYAPVQVLDNGPVMRNYEKLSAGVWIAYDANGKAHRIRKEVHKSKARWFSGALTASTLKALASLIEKQGLDFSFLPEVLKV